MTTTPDDSPDTTTDSGPVFPDALVDRLRPRERKLVGSYWTAWTDAQRQTFLDKVDEAGGVDFAGLADVAGIPDDEVAGTTPNPADGTGTGGIHEDQDKGTGGDDTGDDDADATRVPVEVPPEDLEDALRTVDSALEYAEAHPERADALLAAERAGKNRSTLVAALED